ncbi:RNase P/MRP, p29 subunit [Trichodelitschia bisporula]|uniref:Ribonuclease P protein subunit n=1 Tax=Trichodelitschia bisporula TaxID=703511 RepID=A0A6G1I4T3_9PEZI|nr:RNase P/MRP, p29 subunit [Trichodelitschia bisporula]
MDSTPSSKSHIALDLLSRAHDPSTATDLFRSKIIAKPLFLRPTLPEDRPPNARHERRLAREKKTAEQRKSRKPRPLSSKQKRALQLYALPEEGLKYAVYVPLWRLWTAYVREILGVGGERGVWGRYVEAKGAGPLLAGADFHGAGVRVVRSRCVGRVGIVGIVVRDTKFTFEVVTPGNEVKTVPKEHTVFRFEIPLDDSMQEPPFAADAGNSPDWPRNFVFELHGSAFENRPADRATKRFRLHLPPSL